VGLGNAVALYLEGWCCMSVWHVGIDLVASSWARGSVEGVRGVQETGFLNKGQRDGVGRDAARFS
jgi:hypothetical protein